MFSPPLKMSFFPDVSSHPFSFLFILFYFLFPLPVCVILKEIPPLSKTTNPHFLWQLAALYLWRSPPLLEFHIPSTKKSPKFPKFPFHILKFILSIIKKKMIFQSKNLIFYFFLKTFMCQLLFLKISRFFYLKLNLPI